MEVVKAQIRTRDALIKGIVGLRGKEVKGGRDGGRYLFYNWEGDAPAATLSHYRLQNGRISSSASLTSHSPPNLLQAAKRGTFVEVVAMIEAET